MIVFEHAVNKYVERILEKSSIARTETTREQVKQKIRGGYHEPDFKAVFEQDSCPIYVKGEFAFPVRMEDDEYDQVVIPTVYKAKTFRRKVQ